MSCKYCDIKMRPLDEDMGVLKGESWKDDEFGGDGGYIGQSVDDKFHMVVYYDAGYACTDVSDVKFCPFCGEELKLPEEPLIKDERIRKAVRAWAEACEIESDDAIMISGLAPAFTRLYTSMYEIDIKTESSLGLDEHRDYSIDELCGEEEDDGKTVS